MLFLEHCCTPCRHGHLTTNRDVLLSGALMHGRRLLILQQSCANITSVPRPRSTNITTQRIGRVLTGHKNILTAPCRDEENRVTWPDHLLVSACSKYSSCGRPSTGARRTSRDSAGCFDHDPSDHAGQ